jgi:CheY-like chemotaxis protein
VDRLWKLGITVLVVDDDSDAVESTIQLLKYVGYQAVGAATAEAALKLASTQPPQAVLLGLAMPGRDGCMLAQDLRQLPGMNEAILIYVMGHTSQAIEQRALQAGCDHVMLKPAEWPELLSVLDRLVRKARLPS